MQHRRGTAGSWIAKVTGVRGLDRQQGLRQPNSDKQMTVSAWRVDMAGS